MKKLFLLAGLLTATTVFAQSGGVMRGEVSAGVYENIRSSSGVLSAAPPATAADPCSNPAVAKLSVSVGITTAATTQLVALVSGQVIYVCSVNLSISQVATTPNTIRFVYGTGANCGTGTTNLTGLLGDGGVTAAAPIVIATGAGLTQFKTAVANALCATTAIGASASFQGWVTYVQQ